MLDLTAMKTNYYQIRLLDGTELNIKRPTQSMVEYTLKIEGMVKAEEQSEAVLGLANLFVRILNRNVEGLTFNAEDIAEEYDFQTIGFVIQDYFSYWDKEVSDTVDFQ